MEGLFPTLPKDLAGASDKEIADLLAECEQAAGLIDAEDADFLADRSAEEIIAEYEVGVETTKALRAEMKTREEAAATYEQRKAELRESLVEPVAEESDEESGDEEGGEEESSDEEPAAEEPQAEAEPEGDEDEGDGDEDEEPQAAGTREPVLVASAEEPEAAPEPPKPVEKPRLRRLPPPAADRVVVNDPGGLAFVASGYVGTAPGTKLETTSDIVTAQHRVAKSAGRPEHRADGREERFIVASLDYSDNFPEERRLDDNGPANAEKIAAIGSPYFGQVGLKAARESLVASGGFCAPFTPLYTMPQLATNARPVRDALPSFRAERGGINVPEPTTIGDATGAITVITADDDALGGTFATKACLDLDCPDYNETGVTVISHCREFGNLNAFAWPEKIAHENELTMAEHARTAESYLLSRIKAQSVAVTGGATTLGALIYFVDALEKAEFGMRSRLRLPSESRFQLLAPRVLLDVFELDTISTQFDRYRSQGQIEAYLASLGIDVTWYIDTASPRPGVSDGTSQIADASQAAGALDGFPAVYEMAFFPAGTFLHIDMAELNLGIVRDSTLNSTNDFQIFGETFENVARIGPEQAAYWMTLDICPVGTFPPAGTARSCE